MFLNVAHPIFEHSQDETETYFVEFILIRVLQKKSIIIELFIHVKRFHF